METLIIVFLSSLIGTILGVMSGGGSSVISLPLFLWAGIPLPLAIATHKIYCVFASPTAAYNYLKGKKIDWKFLILFSFIGFFGIYFGVQFLLSIDEKLFKLVMGIIILILVTYTFLDKQFGLKQTRNVSSFRKIISYPVALVMGFYEGTLGTGNGIFFAVLTSFSRGFDLITALGHYNAIAIVWVGFAAFLYIQRGFFDLWIMVSAIIGSVIGSYIGSKYARYKGNKFIKIVFIVFGAILGLKMIIEYFYA